MPLHFLINNTLETISSIEDATKLIRNVAKPEILNWEKQKKKSLEQVALIDTGEAVYVEHEEKSQSISVSLGTTSCLQAFFYNKAQETCLLHYNTDFEINWPALFERFKDKDLKLILVGATFTLDPTAEPNLKSPTNLKALFRGLNDYLNNNREVTVTLVKQLTLTDNSKAVMLPFGIFSQLAYSSKLKDAGFDASGRVFDLSSVSADLKQRKGEELRTIHKHEGEHRAWLSRALNKPFPKAELLVLDAKLTTQSSNSSAHVHQAVIDFARYLLMTGNILNYCEALVNRLHKGRLNEELAQDYYKELKDFFATILAFGSSPEVKDLKLSLAKHPQGPFHPVVQSYKDSYEDEMEAVVKPMLQLRRM